MFSRGRHALVKPKTLHETVRVEWHEGSRLTPGLRFKRFPDRTILDTSYHMMQPKLGKHAAQTFRPCLSEVIYQTHTEESASRLNHLF